MLCERLTSLEDIIERLDKCAFEYKYDGLRVQIHISDGKAELFTRQLENVTSQFPDVRDSILEAFKDKECVIEGECVPVDINTGEILPFQEVSHRRGRKIELSAAIKDYPVVVFLFDCLYLDGEDLTSRPYLQRREKLIGCIEGSEKVLISESVVTDDVEEAEEFFQKSIESGCEGLIAKSIKEDSHYRAGSRGWQWIKFKRDYKSEMDDTVDLVVVGAFAGKGRRAGHYGALLMATYNKEGDIFETVTKLGSGFDDEMLAAFPLLLDEHKIEKKHVRVNSNMKPDFWFSPTLVMEVKGAEITLSPIHTCGHGRIRKNAGLAIRFPRYTGILREDKSPEDATSTDEMVDMYNMQLKKLE
jgi:DNA ligase-1